jgi:hypothetical protein
MWGGEGGCEMVLVSAKPQWVCVHIVTAKKPSEMLVSGSRVTHVLKHKTTHALALARLGPNSDMAGFGSSCCARDQTRDLCSIIVVAALMGRVARFVCPFCLRPPHPQRRPQLGIWPV